MEGELCNTSLVRSLQDNDLDKNSFVAEWYRRRYTESTRSHILLLLPRESEQILKTCVLPVLLLLTLGKKKLSMLDC